MPPMAVDSAYRRFGELHQLGIGEHVIMAASCMRCSTERMFQTLKPPSPLASVALSSGIASAPRSATNESMSRGKVRPSQPKRCTA